MAKDLLSVLDAGERKDWLLNHGAIDPEYADRYTDAELYVQEMSFKAGYGEAVILMLLHNIDYAEIMAFYAGTSTMEVGVRAAIRDIKGQRHEC